MNGRTASLTLQADGDKHDSDGSKGDIIFAPPLEEKIGQVHALAAD